MIGFVSLSSAFWPFTHEQVKESPFNVGVNVNSVPPIIPFVSDVTGDVLNTPGFLSPKIDKGITHANVSFIAEDSNGKLDLNDTSASVIFLGPFGVNNQTISACTKVLCNNCGQTQNNYSCSLDMDYYFISGDWTVNATIKDNSLNVVENNTKTFYYEPYKQVNGSNLLNWAGISLIDENQTADLPLIVENWGNVNFWASVNATALNGTGANPGQQIPASDFSVSRFTGGIPPIECDVGSGSANSLIDGGNVAFGLNVLVFNGTAGSDSANAYFCLYPSLASLGLDPSQSYSSSRPWEANYV